MNEIRYEEHLSPENKEEVKRLFELGLKEFGDLVTADEPPIPLGNIVQINWACIWNNPNYIGGMGVVIATNDRFCMLELGGWAESPLDFYRCEDVIDTHQSALSLLKTETNE